MQAFETPGDVSVRASIAEGEIVVGTAAEQRVEVDVQPLRYNSASREAAEQTRVELVERGGRYEVVVEAPKRWISFGRGASIGVRVTCPERTRLQLSTASGDVRATGRFADVDVKTASGDVAVDVAEGNARLTSASGDLSIAEIGGTGSAKSASGDVDVRLARGSLSVNVASGDVRVERALGSLSVNTASGEAEIGMVEAGEIKAQSVSGDVRIGVREGLRVWIDASSVSGTISSSLPLEDGPAREGSAALELRARTVSGDVRILSATAVAV
jgi:DUF4097 and DUF4098 domain-containing protein YvlB